MKLEDLNLPENTSEDCIAKIKELLEAKKDLAQVKILAYEAIEEKDTVIEEKEALIAEKEAIINKQAQTILELEVKVTKPQQRARGITQDLKGIQDLEVKLFLYKFIIFYKGKIHSNN